MENQDSPKTEPCRKCGQDMELICDTTDTEAYKCYSCRATVLVNKDCGEQSVVSVWRPEITQ
jgi:predicted  nucleic acid-binding Zn ribbon protein